MDNDLLRLDHRQLSQIQQNLASVVKNTHYIFSEMSRSAADIQSRIESLDKKLVRLQKTSDIYLNNQHYLDMQSRQPVAIVRPSPRARRRTNSSGGSIIAAKENGGQFAVATQPLYFDDLCSNSSAVLNDRDKERLMDYRRQIKLIPVRREVLYYETAQGNIIPMDRRHRKMRRSRSMRDGEIASGQPRANCLGLFELRPRSARHSRPHSVDASERLQFLQAVPVLTTGGSVEMSPPPDADKEEAGAGPSGSEEAQTRMKAVPAVFVPVDVSGEVFERYCQMRRSMRGVEYQPVVVKRQRRQQRQRASTAEQRSQSYDALGPQLQALHDPSRTTVPLPGHRFRHSMAIRSPRPPSAMDLEEARRLATVKRSSSMPATPPSTCDFGSWRGSSDLASSGTNSAQGHVKLRRTFSQRAKDFFHRSRSTENTLEDSASSQTSRARSKSPFTWLFRGTGSKDGGDAMTLTSSSCGGSGSLNQEPVVLRKSRDRAKKTPRTLATTNGNASIESQQPITTPDGDVTPMPSSSVKPPQLSSARPPTDVDCPNYKETLHALGQVLSRRHSVIPQTFGGAVPLQGIPVQKAKVWLRSGRDVLKKRRAPDRYSADAMPVAVPVQSVNPLSAPPGRVKSSGSFFASSAQNERKRRSAQEAGQKAKAAFSGQCVGKVSLSHSTSEHLDKLSQQFNKAVTLRRSYRSKKPEDRRSSSGNWSATSSTTRVSRASSAGAQPNLPRSMSRDSALGLHSSSIERSDSLFPVGAVSSSASTSHLASSLSSLSTQRGGGTPCESNDLDLFSAKKQLASVTEHHHSPSHDDSDDVFDATVVPGASSTETLSGDNLPSFPVKRRVPPAPPPRVDSLRHMKRGVRKVLWSDDRSPPCESPLNTAAACDSWYSDLLPYKSNTLPRNLSTRLRKRDSLPSGGGIDMASSWPCPDEEASDSDSEDPPLPPPPPTEEGKKSINFAPRASLNVFDQTAATNTCSAASTHRVLKPQARPASGSSPPLEKEAERPSSPALKQYQRLYSLNKTGQNGGGDSEYEDEATMV